MFPRLSNWWASQEMGASLPPLVLVSGALLSWVWQAVGLGMGIGLLQPPTLAAGTLVIFGALLRLSNNRSLRHLPWMAVGLSTLSLFTFAIIQVFWGAEADPEHLQSSFLVTIPRLLWLVFAVGFAVFVGGENTLHSVFFLALFLAGEVTHFPIMAASETGVLGTTLTTPFLAIVILLESMAVAGVITVFTRGSKGAGFGMLVALLLLHPVLMALGTNIEGSPGWTPIALLQVALAGGLSLAILLVATFLLHRVSLSLRRGLG